MMKNESLPNPQTPEVIPLEGFAMVRYDGQKIHVDGAMSETEADLRYQRLDAHAKTITCVLPISFSLRVADVKEKLTAAYDLRSAEIQKALENMIRESN